MVLALAGSLLMVSRGTNDISVIAGDCPRAVPAQSARAKIQALLFLHVALFILEFKRVVVTVTGVKIPKSGLSGGELAFVTVPLVVHYPGANFQPLLVAHPARHPKVDAHEHT